MIVTGKVSKATVAKGSKSERVSIIIESNGKFYTILKNKDSNPFEYDSSLEPLIGNIVSLTGTIVGNNFILD